MLTGESRQVDVVLDHHDVSHREHVVEASPRVSGDESLDPDELHDPDRHGGLQYRVGGAPVQHSHLPERVTFVGVEAALHDEDGNSFKETEEEAADMTLHGGAGEPGDLLVGEDVGVLDQLCQSAY